MSLTRPLSQEDIDFDPADADALSIQRKVSKRRGNWWQLPADLEDDEGL